MTYFCSDNGDSIVNENEPSEIATEPVNEVTDNNSTNIVHDHKPLEEEEEMKKAVEVEELEPEVIIGLEVEFATPVAPVKSVESKEKQLKEIQLSEPCSSRAVSMEER